MSWLTETFWEHLWGLFFNFISSVWTYIWSRYIYVFGLPDRKMSCCNMRWRELPSHVTGYSGYPSQNILCVTHKVHGTEQKRMKIKATQVSFLYILSHIWLNIYEADQNIYFCICVHLSNLKHFWHTCEATVSLPVHLRRSGRRGGGEIRTHFGKSSSSSLSSLWEIQLSSLLEIQHSRWQRFFGVGNSSLACFFQMSDVCVQILHFLTIWQIFFWEGFCLFFTV